jgi:hypothetical protein
MFVSHWRSRPATTWRGRFLVRSFLRYSTVESGRILRLITFELVVSEKGNAIDVRHVINMLSPSRSL